MTKNLHDLPATLGDEPFRDCVRAGVMIRIDAIEGSGLLGGGICNDRNLACREARQGIALEHTREHFGDHHAKGLCIDQLADQPFVQAIGVNVDGVVLGFRSRRKHALFEELNPGTGRAGSRQCRRVTKIAYDDNGPFHELVPSAGDLGARTDPP